MVHAEYEWLLAGKRIYAQSWLPEKKPRGIINLVHGLGEHSGRYARWGGLFADSGYAFLAMDLFGHGKTQGKKGHVKSYQLLLDQVDLMLSGSEELYPGVPRILYGHSMGGNIVLNYAISKDPPVSALIVSSPWLSLTVPESGLEKVFAGIANSLVPGLRINAGRVGAEALSHDPEHWADVRSDPLVHRKVSVRCAYEVMTRGEYALKHVYKINKPLLLMHGDADEITSHKASEEFVANTSDRTHLKIWEGLRHELHNEFEYKKVFRYILNWLNTHSL